MQHSKKSPDLNYFTRFGQGNLGECTGDLTDQEYANNYYQYNPLSTNVDTIESFDMQYYFNGATWSKVPKDGAKVTGITKLKEIKKPKTLKKRQKPVKENVNESNYIKRFDEFC